MLRAMFRVFLVFRGLVLVCVVVLVASTGLVLVAAASAGPAGAMVGGGCAVEAATVAGVVELPGAVAAECGVGVFVADVLFEVGALVEGVERVVEASAAVFPDGDALALGPGVDADFDIEGGDVGGVDADDGVAEEASVM